MAQSKLLDDLIVLGRACPEPLKDGRITVCLGGYSPTLGFVRLYPTRTDTHWRRWDIVRVIVEKDDRDTRKESWKIAGSRTQWNDLSSKIEVIDHFPQGKWRDFVGNLVDGCVQDINTACRSLGIVKPDIMKRYFGNNPLYGQMFQSTLPGLGESTKVKRDFPVEPRVEYRCSGCRIKGSHNQKVLEWGFYEWIRKNPDNVDQVWENAQFDSSNYDIYFFVGNQFKHRTSFIIISVLRVPTGPIQLPLVPNRRCTNE